MSLIQEALKRKDDENSGIPPKAIPVVPRAAREEAVKQPEIPVKSFVRPVNEDASRIWPVIVILLLGITALALLAVGLLLWPPTRSGQQATAASAAIESPAPPTAVPEPVRASPAPVPKPVEPVVEKVPAAEAVAQAAAGAAPVVFSIPTGIVKEGTTEKKLAPAEVRVVPVPRPVASQSSWPMIKVVGVMAPRSSAQSGAAIIDGNLVECGDKIRGVKVQAVDKSGVWFEFKSQTQFVRVGQTTL